MFVLQGVHFFVLSSESEGGEQLVTTFEVHNFGPDGVVGGFDVSVLGFEGISDDAEWMQMYLEVSLQRMFNPSLTACGSFSFSIWESIASTRS